MAKPTKELIIESPTHGQFKVLYDAEDEDKINEHIWHIKKRYKSSNTYGAAAYFLGGTLRIHQLIMNTPKGMHTDHINGNPLDNRKENLRICSPQQNSRNRRKNKNNKSGFKGVKRCCGKGYEGTIKWMASINFEGKRMHLGVYDIPEEAARAYDAKAKELHGEFAHLNWPDE